MMRRQFIFLLAGAAAGVSGLRAAGAQRAAACAESGC